MAVFFFLFSFSLFLQFPLVCLFPCFLGSRSGLACLAQMVRLLHSSLWAPTSTFRGIVSLDRSHCCICCWVSGELVNDDAFQLGTPPLVPLCLCFLKHFSAEHGHWAAQGLRVYYRKHVEKAFYSFYSIPKREI